MKFIFRVAVISCLFMYTNQETIEGLEHVLVYSTEPAMRTKRGIEKETKASKQAKFIQFVEEKLIEHTQALERILRITADNEEFLKELIEHFTRNMEKPKLPEKIQVHHQDRRSSSDVDCESPVVKFGQGFPTYGTLFKDMLMREFEKDEAPTALVEHDTPQESRRAFGGKPLIIPSGDDRSPSQWCSIAVLCRRTYNPICGYDDNFGYGKFDDLCHMLQVNCYWRYNFALVTSCRPVFKK